MIGRLRNRATLQRTAVRLALAGTPGIGSMLAAESWLDGRGAPDATVPMAEVLVTALAIEAGSRLAADDLALRRWPVGAIDRSWLRPGRRAVSNAVSSANPRDAIEPSALAPPVGDEALAGARRLREGKPPPLPDSGTGANPQTPDGD